MVEDPTPLPPFRDIDGGVVFAMVFIFDPRLLKLWVSDRDTKPRLSTFIKYMH